MPLVSPVAFLTVPDRPVTGLEARGPGASDGQFAGLMTQLTESPTSSPSPKQAPAGPSLAEKGPKARLPKARPSGPPASRATGASQPHAPDPTVPPAAVKAAASLIDDLPLGQRIQAEHDPGRPLVQGGPSADAQGPGDTAGASIIQDPRPDPASSIEQLEGTDPGAQVTLATPPATPPVPLTAGPLAPQLQTQPAGPKPEVTNPGSASTDSMAQVASAAAAAMPTHPSPAPWPPSRPEQALAAGPKPGPQPVAASLAPEPGSPLRLGESAPTQSAPPVPDPMTPQVQQPLPTPRAAVAPLGTTRPAPGEPTTPLGIGESAPPRITPPVPEPSNLRVQQPLPSQGQVTALLSAPAPAMGEASDQVRFDESLATRHTSVVVPPMPSALRVLPSETTPGAAVAPLGAHPPAPQDPPSRPPGHAAMERPFGPTAPLLALQPSVPEAPQPMPPAPGDSLLRPTASSSPEAPHPPTADISPALQLAPGIGGAMPTPSGPAAPSSGAPAEEPFTRIAALPTGEPTTPSVQPPRRTELSEPPLPPSSVAFPAPEEPPRSRAVAAATSSLAVAPPAMGMPSSGPSGPSADLASVPLPSRSTARRPGMAEAPAALAESTAIPAGQGRIVPALAAPEQPSMEALPTRADSGLPVSLQPPQSPSPLGTRPPAPALPGGQQAPGSPDDALPRPGLESSHPAPAAPQAPGQKPDLQAPISGARPADGATLAGFSVQARPTEVAAPISPAPHAPPTPPAPPALQVEGGLKWMLKGGAQEAQLQLHPESLGQVTIHLKVEGGEVHARLWITEPTSMQALRDGRPHLELSLREQGLQLGSFDLQQGSRPFQEATPAPVGRERLLAEAAPTRQEAPAPLPISILNPHHVELYA